MTPLACCPFWYFTHAVNTSGLHTTERRHFQYADACSQCGESLDASTHVASHVMAYPVYPLNCCVAHMSLQTCCRSCNSKHQVGKPSRGDAGFVGGAPRHKIGPWRLHWCCVVYVAPTAEATAT